MGWNFKTTKQTQKQMIQTINSFWKLLTFRSFFQKTNQRILLHFYETSGQIVFVRFMEEIEYTRKTFRNYLTFNEIAQIRGR